MVLKIVRQNSAAIRLEDAPTSTKQYSAKFKEQAVKRVLAGESSAKMARDLGINVNYSNKVFFIVLLPPPISFFRYFFMGRTLKFMPFPALSPMIEHHTLVIIQTSNHYHLYLLKKQKTQGSNE